MDSYRSFPDPAKGDFTTCRARLQAVCPDGIALADVRQTRLDKTKYVWNATYSWRDDRFPNPIQFEQSIARSKFQSSSPAGSVIGSVSTETTVNGHCVWCVVYKSKVKRSKIIMNKIKESIVCCTKRSKPVGEQFAAARLDEMTFSVKRGDSIITIPYATLDESDSPRKVYYQGFDCTRLAVNKTRFSNYSFRTFVGSRKSKSPVLRPIKFVKATDPATTLPSKSLNTDSLALTSICGSSEKMGTKDGTTAIVMQDEASFSQGSKYAAIAPPETYAPKYSSFYLLRDPIAYNNARIYTALKAKECIRERDKVISDTETYHGVSMPYLIMRLRVYGLPVGEELTRLYFDYAASLGISSSQVVYDLRSLRMRGRMLKVR